MAIKDFIHKQWRHAKEHRWRALFYDGSWEIAWWLLDKSGWVEFKETPIWNDETWDICIVMDACRHDLFREASLKIDWLPPKPGSIWSVGSMSPEWIGETYRPSYQEHWQDTGYVTANPFSDKPNDRAAGAPKGSVPLNNTRLAYLDEVWRDQWTPETVDVVNPDTIIKRGLWAWENREMERLVIHMMQPHMPFRSRPDWFGLRGDLEYFGEPDHEQVGAKDVWKKLRDGEVSREAVWDAYLNNLNWGLEWVNWLRKRTNATICITSDHGNGLGEHGVWSHPPNNQSPHLRKVPYVIVNGNKKMKFDDTVSGNPPVTEGGEKVNERLKALGYQ